MYINCPINPSVKIKKRITTKEVADTIPKQKSDIMHKATHCHLLAVVIILLMQWILPTNSSTMMTSQQPISLGVHMVRSPESIVAPKGDEVLFECELNLVPERLKWRFRHTNSHSTDPFQYLNKADGHNVSNEERVSKLRVYVSPDTLGEYQCVAWFGSAAIASVTSRLTLASISVDNANGYSRNAVRWSLAPKNCILIRCGSVTSNPSPVWSFYRNGIKIPQIETVPSSGALVLSSVSAKDSGNYTCSAMNPITGNEVQLPQRIDVRINYIERTPPHFLIQPASSVTAKPGETIVLECPGVGSPPPEAVWSNPDVLNIYNNRTKKVPYGLQITNVAPEDKGTYVCRLDNGISPALVHITKLRVLERPKILRGPAATLTNEGDSLELECSTSGNPIPDVYWLINGEDTSLDNETYHEGRRLVIKRVEKRHAGIVQCFAKNDVGETSESNLLQVNPKQIQGETGSAPLGNFPTKPNFEHTGNKNKGKRKHKLANMIPPSRPNVTRLSDDSVMLRWNVPRNDGLQIQFFKVQYRMLGDVLKTVPRENWQTTNEDIPYGKRDRNHDGVKNFTSSVSGLKPDRYYRFRIIAVYSNNDNKEGSSSGKFLLQRGAALEPSMSHLPPPVLTEVEAISETAIILHWTLEDNRSNMVDGFYAYYRPASTAGEYLKATVDGMNTRKYKIDMLESGTPYEFKLQSFTASAASDFSTILQGKTMKPPTTPSPVTPSVIPATKANEEDNSIYPVVAGAAGGGILLLLATVAACLCMRRRKNAQPEDEDKPQLDHIQADFVTPSVIGPQHHKPSHRINGVMPRMNITPNPLAQDGDKSHPPVTTTMSTPPYHQQTSPAPQSPTMLQKQMHHHQHQLQHQQHPPPVPPHQNNNHHPPTMHYQPPPPPLTPSMEAHRRTLERSARNLHYPQPDSAMNIDGLPTRIPSLRRTRRTSANTNNNNNGGVGIPIVPGSPRVQRSPMPNRGVPGGVGGGAMMKRNRLGSHTENMSSGSLNSIEV